MPNATKNLQYKLDKVNAKTPSDSKQQLNQPVAPLYNHPNLSKGYSHPKARNSQVQPTVDANNIK